MNKKKTILFLLIFILMPVFVLRAEEISLALHEAIGLALRDNRDILLKAEEVKKAKQKIAEAKAELLPTLNFTGTRTLTRGLYFKDIPQTANRITLKQYLYKGGETTNTIKQNKYQLQASEALLDKARLETILNVKKVFYTLLLSEELARINKNIVENTIEHLESLKERYRTGQASESDILNIEASLDNVLEAYEASLNQTQASQALLCNLLYLDQAVKIKPAGRFICQPREIAYTEGLLRAMGSRPEIKQYAAQEEADKKAVEVAKAENRPNIYASWDYYSLSTTSLTFSPTKSWQDYNIIGINFSWPVFDGWATKAKVEQAIIDLKETRLSKEKAIKDIALELKNAYLSLKDAIAKIKAMESELQVYSDNFESIKQKYRQGIVSLLDMEDADLKYAVALFNKKQAIYDYIIAKSSFDKATGSFEL